VARGKVKHACFRHSHAWIEQLDSFRRKFRFAQQEVVTESIYLFISRRCRKERHRSTSGGGVRARRVVRTRHRKRLRRKCYGGLRSRDRHHSQLQTWSSRSTVHSCFILHNSNRLRRNLLETVRYFKHLLRIVLLFGEHK